MSTKKHIICPRCRAEIEVYKNPVPTVDAIIQWQGKILLVQRRNPPYGWALPGGFVDYGETLEKAAVREAREETGLEVELIRQFHSYSDPKRDPRQHTITTVFIARGKGTPKAGDDASGVEAFSPQDLPQNMAFDHEQILRDYLEGRY